MPIHCSSPVTGKYRVLARGVFSELMCPPGTNYVFDPKKPGATTGGQLVCLQSVP